MSNVGFSLLGKARENWLLTLLKYIHFRSPACLKSALGRILAYEWKKKQGDNHFLALLKSACNLFLVYCPLLYLLRLLQRFCSVEPWYPIEYEIVLTTTRVIFTRSKRTTQHICLKLWQRSEDEVCNDKLVIRDEDYLLEGLEFNRTFAKDVYLGIAPVTLSEDTKKIRRGRLIETPKKDELEERVKYALIMRCLNEHCRLDYQLRQSWGSMEVSIFLAKEVARMHERLEKSPGNYGTSDCISSKLNLNSELFVEALGQLSNGQNNLEKYSWISDLLVRVCKDYTELFRQRYNDGHIKRCHGDLKATNLWVYPKGMRFFRRKKFPYFGLKKYPQQLLALDCIDFNPDFCHIDTLSDVAMLAVDIEMHVTRWTGAYKDMEYAQTFANVFLDRYLREMKEDSIDTWPLLRYYMTEKAMVCAYVSILYDGQPELGQRYLDIAYIHAQQLGRPIEAPAKPMASAVS